MKTLPVKNCFFSRLNVVLRWLFTVCCCLFAGSLISCKNNVRYTDYVSELRGNIFLAQTDELSLKIYAVTKEIPYVADGVPKERSTRTEVHLTAPSGDKEYTLSFEADGKTYGGEMSFDNVKAEYYFSCTLDVSALREIRCELACDETTTELTAKSVLTPTTLSAENVLNNVRIEEKELFSSLTDQYGFAGEIYIRLLYEEAPYYYVGITDRNGKTSAFLVNAETGKILAKRQS